MFFQNFKALFLCLALSFNVNAAKKNVEIRKTMKGIAEELLELTPYIVSDQDFQSKKNKKIILKQVSLMKKGFAELSMHPSMNMSGLSLNRSVMSEQLSQIESLYKDQKFDLARYKFLSALNLCVSCHSQSEEKNIERIYTSSEKSGLLKANFEKAEYFYLTRQYENALKFYNLYINEFKKSEDDEKLFRSFERKLNYYIRVKRDYSLAKQNFTEDLKNKDIPNRVRAEVNDWLKILSGKSLWDGFDPKKVTDIEMDKFLKTFDDHEEGPIFTVTDSTEVLDMDLSSILLEYYNFHPDTKLGAKILYWLAVLDKRLNDDLFFSLGDLYLVQCMEKYPQDPVARDCFETYVEDLEFYYLSKKSKNFPKEIKQKIENYKKLINYKEEIGE